MLFARTSAENGSRHVEHAEGREVVQGRANLREYFNQNTNKKTKKISKCRDGGHLTGSRRERQREGRAGRGLVLAD